MEEGMSKDYLLADAPGGMAARTVSAAKAAHIVQLYEHDDYLLDRVARHVLDGLAGGEAAVVIATATHLAALEVRLRAAGIDVVGNTARGLFVALDAAETLARFMVLGRLDEASFRRVVGEVVARAAEAAPARRVSAFGEMVALLWADGREEAAIELERLWNGLIDAQPLRLLCAYPIEVIDSKAEGQHFLDVCALHGAVIPAESFTTLESSENRSRLVGQLQQKARALEVQVAARRELQRSLEHRERELAESNRRKDEFLAMLSHELRNPLGAISSAVGLLGEAGSGDDRVIRAQAVIGRQVSHLVRLVDDLLDVSRLQAGKIALALQPTDLKAIAEQALLGLAQAGRAGAHKITIEAQPAPVMGDPARLEQVITNVLDNALKYTPDGGRIDVRVGREGQRAVVRVRDTGIGVAADRLPHIFDMFVQVDQPVDRSRGGLGLGLALVRQLVDLHGGSVRAVSEGPGAGTEIVVDLPLRLSVVPERKPAAGPALRGPKRRIVLVEDHADARESLRLLLEAWGHEVHDAADGVSGCELVLALKPDVALVDIGLPGMDGYQVARAIRAHPGGQSIRLVALTGYGKQQDRGRAEEAGFDTHLVKPVQGPALLRELETLDPGPGPARSG
jgi:signal transduction histidine kinase/ActR/RegA family two-component response regulator